VFIGLPVDAELLAAIDKQRGPKSRSLFIREAIYKDLDEMGVGLSPDIVRAPDRVGKGGRPKKILSMPPAMVAKKEKQRPTKKD
jgi:hypothetical protein